MTDTQFRSFAEVFSSALAGQGIDLDPTYLPDDPSQCDAYLQGDGTHLAGTAFETYVDAWGWETLRPYLEAAIAATQGVEWTEDAGQDAADDDTPTQDERASWIYDLLCRAGLENTGLDPYGAPFGEVVIQFIQGQFADSSLWPELAELLASMDEAKQEETKQALAAAVDQVGPPPAA